MISVSVVIFVTELFTLSVISCHVDVRTSELRILLTSQPWIFFFGRGGIC